MVGQLTLFDAPGVQPISLESEIESSSIEWSYSRRGVVEQCPLWYYRQYYGASAKLANEEPQKQLLRFLKTLSNCHLRAGEIAHLVIRTYLHERRWGRDWPPERLVNWGRDIFRRDLEFSRQYHRGDPYLNSAESPVLLLEFYYGFQNAEELWARSEEQLVTALTNFRMLPALAPFRAGACRDQSVVESHVLVKDQDLSMRGQIDLAYPADERLVVVDWKIGDSGSNEESLQLMFYAIAAMNKFQCKPEDIDLYRVHLGSGLVSHFTVSSKQVLRARARIIQDLERMKSLDDYGRNAIAEAFTPCRQSRICAMCPFQALCPKELKKDDRDEYSDIEAGT